MPQRPTRAAPPAPRQLPGDVVSADHGGATAAASLAVTLARSGVRTALVCCNTHYDITQDAPLVRGNGPTLPTCSGPGLLSPGHSSRSRTSRPPGRGSRARTAASSPGSCRRTPSARRWQEIEALVEVVVIDVAPTAVNADAQTVVSSTQGMLLVATSDRTAAGEVVDAWTR